MRLVQRRETKTFHVMKCFTLKRLLANHTEIAKISIDRGEP
jgi:hypothetical protein